jgi:hypothetical protein
LEVDVLACWARVFRELRTESIGLPEEPGESVCAAVPNAAAMREAESTVFGALRFPVAVTGAAAL